MNYSGDKYLRLHWEVEKNKIDQMEWMYHAKGGSNRKWYGNLDTVVKFDSKTIEHYRTDPIARFPKKDILFRQGVTWSLVSSNKNLSVRLLPDNVTFNKAAATILFNNEKYLYYTMGLLNSNVTNEFLILLNPTLNNNIKDILNIPFKLERNYFSKINKLVEKSIDISNVDWDMFETSWDFEELPLIKYQNSSPLIEQSYNNWVKVTNERFNQLKESEEELNRIFIDIYGLADDLTPEVSNREVTITRIYDGAKDIPKDIKGNQYVLTKKNVIQQFISYAVGCMFGRYSLDEEGLINAGGELDASKYKTFDVVEDNIIPITSDVFLEDDLVNRFIEFVETVYGKETLEENLSFIAEALGQKKNEVARDTIHSYFLKDFFKDHSQMYSVRGSGRRPIYWKFTSGKENAFNCFIYMHRYDKTTISRIRTEYLHDVQQRLETRKIDLDQIINSDASATELNKARKEMKAVEKQLAELVTYDEKLRHMADQQIEIDLDDRFNVNYPKFKGLVEKV
jgi:hypothetical protein